MKKICLVIAVLCMAVNFAPQKASAADVSVGAMVWYAAWDPIFKQAISDPALMDGKSLNPIVTDSSFKMDPSLLYGPLVSIKLSPNWTLSNAFLFGTYQATASTSFAGRTLPPATDYPLTILQNYSIKSTRFDLDSTLNYAITSYIKFFGGFKLQGYDYTMNADAAVYLYAPAKTHYADVATEQKSTLLGYGPGAGVAFGFPLFDDLFLLCNVSGVYMFSTGEREQTDVKTVLIVTPGTITTSVSTTRHYRVYGGNSSVSIAYYFPSTKITVALGGRYQYLKFKATNSGADQYDGRADTFYGINLSVLYTF